VQHREVVRGSWPTTCGVHELPFWSENRDLIAFSTTCQLVRIGRAVDHDARARRDTLGLGHPAPKRLRRFAALNDRRGHEHDTRRVAHVHLVRRIALVTCDAFDGAIKPAAPSSRSAASSEVARGGEHATTTPARAARR